MNDSDIPMEVAQVNWIWRFGDAEYDESRRELHVSGQVQTVEAKPLALLQELLSRDGEVATKQELLDAVWDRLVVEQSLTTAISKLRAALGNQGRAVIEAVHGIGYRIGVPIELRAGPEKPRLAFTLRAGDPIPNRPQWCLDRAFSAGQTQHVWLARHAKTGELRVFKFADTAQRLDALKREAALSRILHNALGDQPGFVRIIEWNFETRPYFIESAYGGPDLVDWAQARGGLSTFSLNERVGMVAGIARIVAAAHSVGILHRDIKPTNILVSDSDGAVIFRLVDFGSGRLTEAARLHSVTVTGLGLTGGTATSDERVGGTLRYMAPEVLAGGPPTIAADVYALGILLYQMIVGDLDRALGAGWENDVADPQLRDDVGAAASSDVGRRLSSAIELAERLESLEQRRLQMGRLHQLEQQSKYLAQQVERSRMRRPWLVLAAASILLGLIGTSASALRAGRARNQAQRQADISQQVNSFLTDDLLGRGNPFTSGKASETLMEAAERAEPHIAQRFSKEPLVAATIYAALAQAFAGRTAYPQAREAFDRAAAAYDQAEGPGSADTTILHLRQVQYEVASTQPGSLERAKHLIADARMHVDQLGPRTREAQAWLLAAQATTQFFGGDMQLAQREFEAAGNLADTMQDVIGEEGRIGFRQKEAISYARLGQWDKASALLNTLLPQQEALHGSHHPHILSLKQIQAMVLMSSGQALLAVKKIDEIIDDMIKVYGADHLNTLQAYSTRAAAEGMIERYDGAIRDDMVVYKASLAKQGPRTFFTFGSLSDVANSECRSGHANDGLPHALEAYGYAKETFGKDNAITQGISSTIAFCFIVAGKYVEADKRLDGFDEKGIGQFTSDPDEAALISLMRAAIANGEGDRERAKELLRGPLQSYSKPTSDRYLSRWTTALNQSLSVALTK